MLLSKTHTRDNTICFHYTRRHCENHEVSESFLFLQSYYRLKKQKQRRLSQDLKRGGSCCATYRRSSRRIFCKLIILRETQKISTYCTTPGTTVQCCTVQQVDYSTSKGTSLYCTVPVAFENFLGLIILGLKLAKIVVVFLSARFYVALLR